MEGHKVDSIESMSSLYVRINEGKATPNEF